MLRIALTVIIVVFSSFLFAQEPTDSIAAKDTTHSFKKAMIYSAILPGAGQVYNHIAMPKGQKKAYWKIPIIYAGLGATGYYTFRNNQLKNAYRREYEYRQNNNGAISNFEEYDDEGLLTLHSMHRTRRDLCLVGMTFVYLLNVLDAGVEAHFVNFDVSNDLTLSVLPKFDLNSGYGVSLTLNFR